MGTCPRCKQRDKQPRQGYCKPCKSLIQHEARIRVLFNLSGADYKVILKHQKGGCAGCKRKPSRYRLSVDHDHDTGLVRGLLCHKCNQALGNVKDSTQTLEALVTYLIAPPATEALGEPRIGRKGRVTTRTRRTRRKKKNP